MFPWIMWLGMAAALTGTAEPTVSSTTASGLHVAVHEDGSYILQMNDKTLLFSSATAPCGVQHNGTWCRCGTSKQSNDAAGSAERKQCTLSLQNRTSSEGTDPALGQYTRTELRWGFNEVGKATTLLITAVRVFASRSTATFEQTFPLGVEGCQLPHATVITPLSAFPSWDTRQGILGDTPGTLAWAGIGNGNSGPFEQSPSAHHPTTHHPGTLNDPPAPVGTRADF
jgi:hypothetical protein